MESVFLLIHFSYKFFFILCIYILKIVLQLLNVVSNLFIIKNYIVTSHVLCKTQNCNTTIFTKRNFFTKPNVKLLFSSHPENRIFTYHVYIFLPWISWIIRKVSSRCFCFAFHLFLNCVCSVLLFFSLATFERIRHRSCSVKKVFLKILKNWQENTCVGVFFSIELQALGLQLY